MKSANIVVATAMLVLIISGAIDFNNPTWLDTTIAILIVIYAGLLICHSLRRKR